MQRSHHQEIACQQVLVEDSSVFSIQWSLFPAEIAARLTPRHLLDRYLIHIRSCTFSAIRPFESSTGIEFRLLGSRLSLISFLPPEVGDGSITLHIRGGLLVQPHQCRRGELRFAVEQTSRGATVSLQLSDYCPLILGGTSPSFLRRWLYRLTQAALHRRVTIRFLAGLYRELAGSSAPVRVVPARIREGRPV
ncbi:MAG: hypothetical protein JJE30_02900 [Desulfuromonadales bacterium]|nr:hypothetical protein [Desulfuromonadales bacterium]